MKVRISARRLIVRGLPGFTWIQFGLGWRWKWHIKGFWSVRGIAKSRHLGPLWVCTMRTDCIERAKRNGLF